MHDANAQLVAGQTASFELATVPQAMAFAEMVAKSSLLPAHFRGNPANCLRLVLIASRWQMDPFMVAEKTSVINEKLMYEGQLVAAVVNSRGNLTRKLTYDFTGTGPSLKLTVTGTIHGEDTPRTLELEYNKACQINKNGQMKINPEQQMCYIGARLWTRRHTPELLLGVYTPDEMDEPPERLVVPGVEGAKVVGPGAESGAPAGQTGGQAPKAGDTGKRPDVPGRRGGVKDAKTVPGETIETPPNTSATPATEAKSSEATPPADSKTPAPDANAGAGATPPPVKRPEIAPGVNEVGFHGKTWPMVADVTIVSAEPKKAGEQLYVKVKGIIEGHDGELEFTTVEGIAMVSGVPTINTPLLAAGAVLNANIKVKDRPKKGTKLPDLERAPALFLEAIADPDAGPFG